MKYDYKAVEAKWQKVWEDEKTFHVEIDHKKTQVLCTGRVPVSVGCRPACRPSPQLHALDVVSRKRRQNGYNVLYPMAGTLLACPLRTLP